MAYKFKNRLFALLTAAAMTLCTPSVFAEEQTTAPQPAEDPMEKVESYSNYMQKNMIKAYAHTIADNYYYGITDEELLFSVICNTIDNGSFDINSAIEAMINRLDDKHAAFYTPEEYKAMTEDISGEFSGIGVVITQNGNGVVVLSVYDGSPSAKAGIAEGDYIIGVNGTSTEGMTTADVRSLVVGETGSDVEIELRRGDTTFKTVCTRAPVTVKHTETKMLSDEIGYLKLTEFSKNSPDEVQAYVDELQKNRVKKLVLDLRNNPGGDLDAALAIANIFISAGKLGELRYKDSDANKFVYSTNYNAPKLKIAVLVNENSASASEFLSMAFQGRGAAEIIGTKTYGKGSMQVLSRLLTGAGMKYTFGEFYSVKGDRINTIGITPDIAVENDSVKVDESAFEKIDFDKVEEGTSGGKMTLALEQRLNALGYFDEEPDETFNESTAAAVRSMQMRLGYDASGIPGFYEYLYLNDISYDFYKTKDNQLAKATEYLENLK